MIWYGHSLEERKVLLSKDDWTTLFIKEHNLTPKTSTYFFLVDMCELKKFHIWEKKKRIKVRDMFVKLKVSRLLRLWLKEANCLWSDPLLSLSNGWMQLSGAEHNAFNTWKRELLARFPEGRSRVG